MKRKQTDTRLGKGAITLEEAEQETAEGRMKKEKMV